MPPKKKGKGKKGKKGKKKGKKLGPAPHPLPPTEGTREYYLDRIKHLQKQVTRYQDRQYELEMENIDIRIKGQGFDTQESMLARMKTDEAYQQADTEFKEKYKEMEEDREYKALKRKMEQDNIIAAELRTKVEKAALAVEEQKENYRQEMSAIKLEFQETRGLKTSERTALEKRLRELEKFKEDKEGFLERVANMERTLEEREQQHELTIREIYEKQDRDKEVYKKNMMEHLRQVAMTFRKDSQRYMPETTKRMVHENVIVTDQIGKMADRMSDLDAENEDLREVCRSQAQQIKHLEQREKELAKESCSSGKIVRLLTGKFHEQEVLVEGLLHKEDRQEELKDTNHAFQADIVTNKKLATSSRRKRKENNTKKASLENEFRTLKAEVENMEVAIQESVKTLADLQALPHQMCSPSPLPPLVDHKLEELLAQIQTALDYDAVAEDRDHSRRPEDRTCKPFLPATTPLPPLSSTTR